MSTPKFNTTAKTLKSFLAKEKKVNQQALLEYELAFQNNNNRGHVYNQEELFQLYPTRHFDHCGASKGCFTYAHNGKKFEHIVIKRHRPDGWTARGNQLIDEINAWQKLANTEDSDLLCPILKYFTSKSDKVTDTSKKMIHNVVIIAIKAVYVDDAKTCCCMAERMNKDNGYHGESAHKRYEKLEELSNKMGWWDAMRNNGNSGVIFDHEKQCFKAVFIDYAL